MLGCSLCGSVKHKKFYIRLWLSCSVRGADDEGKQFDGWQTSQQSVQLISIHLLPHRQTMPVKLLYQLETTYLIRIQARSINHHLVSFTGSFPSTCFPSTSHAHTWKYPRNIRPLFVINHTRQLGSSSTEHRKRSDRPTESQWPC